MNTLHLRYFVKVAETGHVTNAAKELYISQPALSKAISALEAELQVPLLESKGRNIQLSEYGRIFYPAAKAAIENVDTALADIRTRRGVSENTVRLAALCFTSLTPDLLSRFKNIYPHIDFKLFQHIPFSVAIENCDLCIDSSPEHRSGVTYIELLQEEILLAVHKDHKLASKDRVAFEDLAGENFVGFDRRSNLRKTVDELCERQRFVPNYTFESDDPATIKRIVGSGLSICFVPAIPWRMYPTQDIVLLPLDCEKAYRTIELCYKDRACKNNNISQFKDFAVEYFNDLMIKFGSPE